MKSNISRYISIYFTNICIFFCSGYFLLVDLNSQRYFDCSCRRCSDPTECGSFISAVRCFKDCKGEILSDASTKLTYYPTQCHSAVVRYNLMLYNIKSITWTKLLSNSERQCSGWMVTFKYLKTTRICCVPI